MFLMSEPYPSLVNTAPTIQTDQPDPSELHPLLASRWSPRAFDPLADVTPAEVASLLDAARWAPSYDNSQPWRFVVGRRDDETYKRIFTNLGEENQRWAGRAALLLVGAYDTDGPAGYGAYDLGQAIAHLSMQAGALGLYVHQMGDFDAVTLHADLELPDSVVARVAVAVGQLGDPATLPEDLRVLEVSLRQRRPIAELLLG
jgi:nitroreductase